MLADDIADELLDISDIDSECRSCELPAQFGLPCKHWMIQVVVDDVPLALALSHPRWLHDGPQVLHDRWSMSWTSKLHLLSLGQVT